MKAANIVIGVLMIAVAILFYYVFVVPPTQIAVIETRIEPSMNWLPWSWGAGGFGWPGAFYASRPMPHFYPRDRPMRAPPATRHMGPVAGPGPQHGGRPGAPGGAAVVRLPATIAPRH